MYRPVLRGRSPAAGEIGLQPRRSRADTLGMRLKTFARLGSLLVAVLLIASACSPQQQLALDLINQERAAAGLNGLLPSPHAMAKAQAWAEFLAASNTLQHSDLREGMPDGFLRLGENVGRGPSIESIERGFMNSPAHRANVLDRRFDWAGTGHAVAADGTVYVVQVFAKY